MAELAGITLQELCHQAYQTLCGLWPSWGFDKLVFGPTDPYGQEGSRIWFCGNVYIGATGFRYVCVAESEYDRASGLWHFTPYPILFPHNTYFDLLFIRRVITQELKDPDLFRRDHPPPTWLLD